MMITTEKCQTEKLGTKFRSRPPRFNAGDKAIKDIKILKIQFLEELYVPMDR